MGKALPSISSPKKINNSKNIKGKGPEVWLTSRVHVWHVQGPPWVLSSPPESNASEINFNKIFNLTKYI
jgi:hypothetical protein